MHLCTDPSVHPSSVWSVHPSIYPRALLLIHQMTVAWAVCNCVSKTLHAIAYEPEGKIWTDRLKLPNLHSPIIQLIDNVRTVYYIYHEHYKIWPTSNISANDSYLELHVCCSCFSPVHRESNYSETLFNGAITHHSREVQLSPSTTKPENHVIH